MKYRISEPSSHDDHMPYAYASIFNYYSSVGQAMPGPKEPNLEAHNSSKGRGSCVLHSNGQMEILSHFSFISDGK